MGGDGGRGPQRGGGCAVIGASDGGFTEPFRTGAAWNETHWSNAEFDSLLDEFDRTLDQEVRRGQLDQLCQLSRNVGCVMIPGFRPNFAAKYDMLHYKLHPQAYVWMDVVPVVKTVGTTCY